MKRKRICEIVSLLKKYVVKKQLFRKIGYCGKKDLLKKLRRSTWFKKVLLLKMSLFEQFLQKKVLFSKKYLPQEVAQEVAARQKFCSEKVAILKNQLMRRGDCSEKGSFQIKSAALKKQLLHKSNCCVKVVTLEKCEKVISS